MEKQKLQELLLDMSLTEKIEQLLQISGAYLENEGMVTGPENTVGFTQEEVELAGTVLGSVGAAKLRGIQKKYLEKQPHRIPLIFMADIINGYRTIFPIPLAQGCSFDPQLACRGAEIAARESAAAGLHLTFSPMVDLVRDARWGRVMESTGEDPYLNSRFAEAIVEGYQGKKCDDGSVDLKKRGKIAACVKHFAAYGAPAAGRDYNTVELSERTLRDDYLPSYQAAIDAGAAMLMTSFNTLDRIPSSGNRRLMRDILRDEMRFKGVVISDWAAIEEMLNHGIAEDRKEAAKLAIEACVDIDLVTTCYCRNLESLVKEGIVSEALIDEAVMRILELKNQLGLFENPYKDADEQEEKELILCKEHRLEARKAAADTFVLLKNENILPLKKDGQKVAFIGPHVESRKIIGAWSLFGKEEETVSIADALKARGIAAAVAKGSAVLDDNRGLEMFGDYVDYQKDAAAAAELLEEAVTAAKEADAVVLALGEHRVQSGEAASRADIGIPECQMELFDAVLAVNPNVIVALFSGRPLDIRKISAKARAVLAVWQPGTEGGNAIADVLYGDVNPSAKLAMSFPWSVGQVPVYYNEMHTGRPYKEGMKDKYLSKYLDIPNRPLYPFGYGLSYTTFEISPVRLSCNTIVRGQGESVSAGVTVKNTGTAAGKEVVQLYIRDHAASVARPVRELKGFEKIALAPGEEKEVIFTITEDMLSFTNIDMEFTSEVGAYSVYVGNSSETENEGVFTLI
ncbi:MAG: beta-glucosidase BglX [Lachnospiraceae bacterium]|nr:beta-glucosidase BglX [Lachnospiraceae bacterium]